MILASPIRKYYHVPQGNKTQSSQDRIPVSVPSGALRSQLNRTLSSPGILMREWLRFPPIKNNPLPVEEDKNQYVTPRYLPLQVPLPVVLRYHLLLCMPFFGVVPASYLLTFTGIITGTVIQVDEWL